ncbi:riboflavin synthase subunit alpha [Corynebacterium atypicum]|uniref:Riboflavin synthase n=1 Tax=Corynebacterium atypicum TaxID=191610 RepID=A0ABM5QMN4_9CORY|nr:riboflavin synthase [Corynebacterium atypicum]AIG64082.1 riboflavin synthase subunit alpha [Corynebacterium atypicum]
MFTGIVEEIGTVRRLEDLGAAARLTVGCRTVLEGTRLGDSIAVDGVCLTVAEAGADWFTADVMQETLNRTTLGGLPDGAPVNLERALAVGGRLGGHLVQGHVEGGAELVERRVAERWEVLRFQLPETLARYVVEKGSIAVSGTSLTVAMVGADFFEVSLIPATLAATTLGALEVGDLVNIETDLVAKYVERFTRA